MAKKTTKNGKKRNVGTDLQDTILEAAALSEQITSLTVRLEGLKDKIRDDALSIMGELNSIAIDTDLGKCHVVRVKDALTVAPGFDADVLKKTLPRDLWNLFFMMSPQLRGTAGEAYQGLTEHQRGQLGETDPFVFVPRKAQVRLPK